MNTINIIKKLIKMTPLERRCVFLYIESCILKIILIISCYFHNFLEHFRCPAGNELGQRMMLETLQLLSNQPGVQLRRREKVVPEIATEEAKIL